MKSKGLKSTPKKNTKPADKDMMESFNISPWYSVGKVLPTSTAQKEDVFDAFRPNRQCVEYKISETWAKMQRGDVKVNYRETTAEYKEIPPEICKPQKVKKIKYFSGGPPQWKFIDELWLEDQEKRQKECKKQHLKNVRDIRAARKSRMKHGHDVVQRMVGPEWFMELSPKQLQAIDCLKLSIPLDLKNRTITFTQDILAALGLVLRPSKNHIAKALQHCCGSPEEFLLVLYQIMDPKRKSYSLNDRLLLSSVVHLTITSTLRELHIRIPSPPRLPKTETKRKKSTKRVNYESPYLEPLVYWPAPPRFTGIYTNKHRQYPESPYFSYLPFFEYEKRFHGFEFNYSLLHGDAEHKARMTEYKDAQDFFASLPGVKQLMLNLIPPASLELCPNLLHRPEKALMKENLIAPHLCQVSLSEVEVCFCSENCQKLNHQPRQIKRSCCEKNAMKYLQSLCLCDDCLEKITQANTVRIHGGFLRTPCKCDNPIPLIQGTLLNRTCDCYKEYRNRVVGSAARQFLIDQPFKFIVSGVTMTKNGPVYNIQTSLGKKICKCGDIRKRKTQVKQMIEKLTNNKAKFVIGGMTVTKFGLIYNLIAVVARKPCTCVIKYRNKRKILQLRNEIRKNHNCFVNNGLINGKQGPAFCFSSVVTRVEPKTLLELHEICSCELIKPKCFQRCLAYVEYRVFERPPSSSTSSSTSTTNTSHSEVCPCGEHESTSEETSSSIETEKNYGCGEQQCPHCHKKLIKMKRNSGSQRKESQSKSTCECSSSSKSPCKCSSSSKSPCKCSSSTISSCGCSSSSKSSCGCSSNSKSSCGCSSSSCECSSTKSTTSAESGSSSSCRATISEGIDDPNNPRPCRCKEELKRFMEAKCPCEECNRIIRQHHATYVMGGTKTTSSGNQVNMVQGIQQKLCSCMHEHQKRIKRIDDYKSRAQARYNLKKQPHKYSISGVRNTPDGPVYIIAGMRSPVECACAKAKQEQDEQEEYERQRAKMPNTGRIKYEIAGVKAMPKENVFIMSSAINVTECDCEVLLQQFEEAHKPCMDEYEKYLKLTENEIKEFDADLIKKPAGTEMDEKSDSKNTVMLMEDIKFDQNDEQEDDENEEVIEEPYQEETYVDVMDHGHMEIEQPSVSSKDSEDNNEESESEDSTSSEEDSSSDSESSSSETSSETDVTPCGSCHVHIPPEVRPISLPIEKKLPEFFLSKRFAIFRNFPTCKKRQMEILKHILAGMAEDGFPLAKLPQVYKLPIFKLWLELRSGTYWTFEDRLRYYDMSKFLWKHTMICYREPELTSMPYTIKQANKMTWKHAEVIKRVANEKLNEYYRKLKQINIDTGREFFAPTYSYEFPTGTWRDCAFAYLPTKEEDLFPYRIVQPHEARFIPDNKKTQCYC